MAGIREFFRQPAGKAVAIGLFVVAMGVFTWVLLSEGSNPAVDSSTERVFMCSETGKTFKYTIKVGDTIPVLSPYSNKKTGYEPERCYWTADGKAKREPTYVLLNETIGKPGPTFCPDCKRLVVPMNPPAIEGGTPPPTEAEYAARRRQD